MSLINDALKKAQKQQSPKTEAFQPVPASPGSRPGLGHAIPQRGTPIGFERLVLGIGLVALLLAGAVIATVLLLRQGQTPPVAVAARTVPAAPSAPIPAAPVRPAVVALPAVVAPVPTSTPAAVVAAPPLSPPASVSVSPPQAATGEPPAIVLNPAPLATPPPIAAVSAPAVGSVAPPPAGPPPASASPAVSVDVKPAAAHPAPIIKPEYRIQAYIENLHVLGVRAAGDDSKVLVSGRVYRLNDIIDYELGLRLTGVSTTTLTFVDENGQVYTKNL